jgi:hypothetical protein
MTAGEAATPAGELGAPVGEPAPDRVAVATTTLPMGGVGRPAAGVSLVRGVPAGLGLPSARSGARTLTLRKDGLTGFSAVGVSWNAARAAPVGIAVRTGSGGRWSRWRSLVPTADERDPADSADSAGGSGWAAGPAWVGRADALEVAVTGYRNAAPADISVTTINPGTAPGDADAATPDPGVPAGPATRPTAPTIHTRAEWGADERLMTWQPRYTSGVRAIALRDTGTGNDYAPADVPAILRSIYQFQAATRGWGDIGASVLVDRFGRLWEGRYGGVSRAVVGAYAGRLTPGTAGIAIVGDLRSSPTPAPVREAAARYIAWRLPVDPRGSVPPPVANVGSTRRAEPGKGAPKVVPLPRVFSPGQVDPGGCCPVAASDALAAVRNRAYVLSGAGRGLRTRLTAWRPGTGEWLAAGATDPLWRGTPGEMPVPADYDGDAVADGATWNPGTGVWTIHNSGAGTTEQTTLGRPGDRPVPGDYAGDGRAQPATWTPTTGTWHIGEREALWGVAGDVPVPGDYNGDGTADLAVWRPATGSWLIRDVGEYQHLGEAWHIPVPADYNGDGRIEPATYSPASQRWFIWGRRAERFGDPGDLPLPGQYDGDGRADRAVWHPPGRSDGVGTWRVDGIGSYQLGAVGDVPVPMS